MSRAFKITACIATVLALRVADAGDCQFVPIAVGPTSHEPAESFAGRAGVLELRFKNDGSVMSPDAFPESPLVVKNHQSNTTCSIEGGIWARNFVFASSDYRILATKEYSGSNDFVFFYDTTTCSRLGQIDLSEYDVKMTESGAMEITSKTAQESSHRLTSYRVDASCTPRKDPIHP